MKSVGVVKKNRNGLMVISDFRKWDQKLKKKKKLAILKPLRQNSNTIRPLISRKPHGCCLEYNVWMLERILGPYIVVIHRHIGQCLVCVHVHLCFYSVYEISIKSMCCLKANLNCMQGAVYEMLLKGNLF